MRDLTLRLSILVILSGALLTNGAAQTNAAVPSQDDRIKALEERIIAMEGEIRMLKAAQTQAAPTAAAPPVAAAPAATPAEQAAAAPATAAETPTEQPSYGGATGQAKALNPDISVIGDFLGAAGHNPIRPVPSMEMHESEVGFQAIVDPYARADFFISFGEEGVNLEEGFITFTALPAGLVLKAGKMRSAFGKVNTLHNHVLPWTDRPMVTDNLVGGEDGIDDAGLSLTRILPAPKGLFLEGTGQIFRGDSSDVFTARNRSDVSVVGHLHGYRDINESTNIDIGTSYARGHNDFGAHFLTNLYGVDATVRWKPLRRSIYHSFVGRSEFIWSHREEFPVTQKAFGFCASGDYQLGRRWFVGARADRSDRSRNAAQIDNGASLVFTYWPSEFSQLRAQYRFANYAEGIKANELRLQLQFSLGAHGAHPF